MPCWQDTTENAVFSKTGESNADSDYDDHARLTVTSRFLESESSTVRTQLLLAIGMLLLSAGCSALSGKSASKNAADSVSATSAKRSIRLSYETDSSRLNLLARSDGSVAQGVAGESRAGEAQRGDAVPGFTECRVNVIVPHPRGVPDMAEVRVMFAVDLDGDGDVSTIGSIWSRVTRSEAPDSSDAASAPKPREVWKMDIPAWQVEALVDRLRDAQFFRRQTELKSEAELATVIDGVRFSKPTAAIVELDALAVRIRREGRLTCRTGMPTQRLVGAPRATGLPPVAGLSRLPAVDR